MLDEPILILPCDPQIIVALIQWLEDAVKRFAALNFLSAANFRGHLGSLVHDSATDLKYERYSKQTKASKFQLKLNEAV